MDRYWEWIWLAFSLSVLLTDTGFGYSIIEGPRNLTILAGSVAHFNCTVSERWPVLIWLFNGNPILTVLSNGTPIITNPKYNQDGFQNGTEFTSGLKIFDVQLNDSGEIKCSLQNLQDDKYAFLSVQAGDDGRTRTIILAVVLSVVGFLLLILIILLIICCCKRRKDSKYQEEMRKASEKKTADRNLEADRHSGQENYAYSPDDTGRAGQMTGVPSFSPDNSSLYAPDWDLDVNPASQVSYNGRHDGVQPSRTTAVPINPRKIRNVTHV